MVIGLSICKYRVNSIFRFCKYIFRGNSVPSFAGTWYLVADLIAATKDLRRTAADITDELQRLREVRATKKKFE